MELKVRSINDNSVSSGLGKCQTDSAPACGHWIDAFHPDCGVVGFQGYCGAGGCKQAK